MERVIFKRRNPGAAEEGAHRGTSHLRAAEAKKGMLRRAVARTRARPRARPKPNTSTDAYRHHPWPAPNCPPPLSPPNWAAQRHLDLVARAVGKRFRGCRAKRLCVHSCRTSRFQSRSSWLLQRSRQLALWSSPCSSVFGLSLSGVPRALAGQLAARLGVSRATRTARVRPADEADANNIRGRVIHEQTCAKEVPIPLMAIR